MSGMYNNLNLKGVLIGSACFSSLKEWTECKQSSLQSQLCLKYLISCKPADESWIRNPLAVVFNVRFTTINRS